MSTTGGLNQHLTFTPGFPSVMSRDRFLAIWSLLHCVDEDDANTDKTDKIYKTRPVFHRVLAKFKHHYVPGCELSIDEGIIPTKNKLSFRQFIKDKTIKWGIKTYLVYESENGYICNAKVYTGKRDDNNIPGLGVTGNLVVRFMGEFSLGGIMLYTRTDFTQQLH